MGREEGRGAKRLYGRQPRSHWSELGTEVAIESKPTLSRCGDIGESFGGPILHPALRPWVAERVRLVKGAA